MPILLVPFCMACIVNGVANTFLLLGLFAAVAVLLLIFAMMINKDQRDRILTWWDRLFEDKDLWYTDEDEVSYLLCDGSNKPMRVGNLPKKHRTIKLRLSELKSKVCRPFSG